MGRVIGLLCVFAGITACAGALDLLPIGPSPFLEAPRWIVCGGGAVLALSGFMMLGRDHRASTVLASVLLLAVAAGTGWITFYAPQGTLGRAIPFIPASVSNELGRLLFGLSAIASIGMAAAALRRLLR
jgi:hypothetical protein